MHLHTILLLMTTSLLSSAELVLTYTKDDTYVAVNIRDNGSVLYRNGKKLFERDMNWIYIKVDDERAGLIIQRALEVATKKSKELGDLVFHANEIYATFQGNDSTFRVSSDSPDGDTAGLLKLIETLSPEIRFTVDNSP
jgi:hypothetical protein